jgi:hypothetical protein
LKNDPIIFNEYRHILRITPHYVQIFILVQMGICSQWVIGWHCQGDIVVAHCYHQNWHTGDIGRREFSMWCTIPSGCKDFVGEISSGMHITMCTDPYFFIKYL